MVFDVRSCAAGGEADPSLFIHGTQRVLMRIYVHGRQTAEKKTDDTMWHRAEKVFLISESALAELQDQTVVL